MKQIRMAVVVSAAMAAMTLGCTGTAPVAEGNGNAMSPTQVRSLDSNYDGLFARGRYELARGDNQAAVNNFQRALALRPDDVRAGNALAVAYASLGRLDDAIATFGRLLAREPRASHLHGNLGFALLKAGRLDEARASLDEARRLEPDNLKTLENLALLQEMRGTAGAVARSPARDGAAPLLQAKLPEGQTVVDASVTAQTLVRVAPGIYELRDPRVTNRPVPVLKAPLNSADSTPAVPVFAAPALAIASAPAPAPAPTLALAPTSASPIQIRSVEVSNGVGTAGLARRTARGLETIGVRATKITDYRDFSQIQSQIQYRPGNLEAAQSLRDRLPGSIMLVRNHSLKSGIDVRLVLGRDFVGQRIVAWADGTQVFVVGDAGSVLEEAREHEADGASGADAMTEQWVVRPGWRWL